MSFHKIKEIKWKKVPLEEAIEHYDIAEASNDSVGLEDLFADKPMHFFVYKGDANVQSKLFLSGKTGADSIDQTVYVIDGNLIVNGPLVFSQLGTYTSLYVTGSVIAESIYCGGDSCFFVGKSMEVKNLLITSFDDMGHLVIQGSLSAKAWINNTRMGCIEIKSKPKAQPIRHGDTLIYQFKHE